MLVRNRVLSTAASFWKSPRERPQADSEHVLNGRVALLHDVHLDLFSDVEHGRVKRDLLDQISLHGLIFAFALDNPISVSRESEALVARFEDTSGPGGLVRRRCRRFSFLTVRDSQ